MKWIRYTIQALFFVLFIAAIVSGKMLIWMGLFVVSLITALFFGRFYCGYVCPMNTLMGPVEKLSRKLKWQSEKTPKFLTSRWLPWVVLLLMVASMLISKRVLHKNLPALLILLAGSVLITLRYKPWVFHNHVCPYGALLRIFGKKPVFATVVNEEHCIGCRACERVCPSQAVRVDDESQTAAICTELCHQCGACIAACPTKAILYQRSSCV